MRTYTPKLVQEPTPEGGERLQWTSFMAEQIHEGISFVLADILRKTVHISKKEYAAYLGVDPRTLRRFEVKNRLNPAASDRAYRLARLLEAATELHDGDTVRAVRWLKTPNRALGDQRPIDMVATQPDYDRVMNLIGALQEGVFV